MNTNCEMLYVTCPDEKQASELSILLLQNHLCACTNIIPQVKSHYWWQGKIETSQEVVLIIKTTKKMQNKIIEFIKSHHPYQTPCIVCYDISGGHPDYLNWITTETSKR